MKKVALLIFIGLILTQTAFAVDYDTRFGTNTRNQPGYFKNLVSDWKRGLTNIFTSPAEVPITMKKYYQESKSQPVFRELAGFADGGIRALMRATSGVWDLVMGFVPGDQDGSLVQPETLFGNKSAEGAAE